MTGFWSASLFADITLVVQILFYLVLCAGVVAQLQGKYKLHDRLQIPVVVLNFFFIIFVMIPTFRSIAGELPDGIGGIPNGIAIIHAGLGTLAQLVSIYCLLAGLKILPRKIGVLRYWMWGAFTAWTATIIFGIGVYMAFYLTPAVASTDSIVTEHDADLIEEHAEPIAEPTSGAGEEAVTPAETDQAVSEHVEEPVEVESEPTEAEPTEEIISEHEEEAIAPEPSETEETREVVDEQAEDTTVVEPEFTDQVAQAQWQPLEPTNTGPGPRYGQAMQYNPATNQMFVFGGHNGTQALNDVWALEMESLTWRQLAVNTSVAPPARFSTVMIVDEAGQNLYIATGHTPDGQNFNDVWKLDLNTETWTDLSLTAGQSPEPRYGAPGGNLGGHLVTTHGFGSTRYDDTWRFNIDTEQWENITPSGDVPLRRCLFAAAPVDASLVMHGGCASGFGDCFLDDTWVLDTNANAWRQVSSEVKPDGRQHQSLVAGESGSGQVILFGGQDASRASRNDLWALNLASNSWQFIEAPDGPEPRYQHAVVWLPGRGMLMYGGRSDGILGDMWLLNVQPTATEAPSPEPEPEPTPTPVPDPTPTPELISEHDGG